MTAPTILPPGRPFRGGSPEASAADRQQRREEYVDLRERLGMPAGALAKLLGLSEGTVRGYPGWSTATLAPTRASLARMRAELDRRTRAGIPPELRPRGNSPAAAADRDRRRHEYVDLRKRLALPPAELSKVTGLTVGTLNTMPGWTTASAPTDATLAKMRAELVRRARQTIEEAEARAEIEADIAEHEARWHMEQCAAEALPWEDAA